MTGETGLPQAAVEALRRGNKVEAIKIVRRQSGLGLKEAKDLVDASGIERDPGIAPGQVRGGGAGWLVAAVVALAIAGWLYLR